MTTLSGAASVIRYADAADLPALGALEADAFDHPWSEPLLLTELASPRSFVLLAGRPDTPDEADGYAALRLVADEAELLRVAVRPGARRRGLAAELVRRGLADAAAQGAARCFLEVRTDNGPARALYRRLGFVETGRREGYYADGAAALVLSLELLRPALCEAP